MKNRFEIQGNQTIIFAQRPDGTIREIFIDTNDLSRAQEFPNSWCVVQSKGQYIVRGTYRVDEKKKQIPLKQYLLQSEEKCIIYNIDGNGLDNRRCNLATNKEPERLRKSNRYKVNGAGTRLFLSRRNDQDLEALIDTEDLEKVLSFGTWFAEWHNDIEGYLVQCVRYVMDGESKRRKKVVLHKVLLNTPDGKICRYKNGNTLDNRKCNIVLYANAITNDYEIRGDITAIFLRQRDGTVIETLIDTEDLEKVNALGYTLHFFQGEGYPYVVGKKDGKNVYLHRYIVDAEAEYDVDHINHITLDNRKCNLNEVSKSLNQQNRKGARKNSRSAIRGVSWDNRNQDWIVNIKGIYLGRFKDLEQAKKLACEKIKEFMPYAINQKVDKK